MVLFQMATVQRYTALAINYDENVTANEAVVAVGVTHSGG
jgi:hypothetical protein